MDSCPDLGVAAAHLTRAPRTDDCWAARGGREAALHCPSGRSWSSTGGHAGRPKTAPPSAGASADPFHCVRKAQGLAKTGAEARDARKGKVYGENTGWKERVPGAPPG